MKKLLLIVLTVIMVLSVVACSAAPATESSAASVESTDDSTANAEAEATQKESGGKQQIKVAFVFDILDVNQQDHVDHIRYQLELINDEQDEVEFTDFTGYNCNMVNEEFLTNMETAVTAGYNLIFTMPVDSEGCIPAYQNATAAGVKVEMCIRDRTGTSNMAFFANSLHFSGTTYTFKPTSGFPMRLQRPRYVCFFWRLH